MNRINEIIAGLSFLGVLSATGYAEIGKLPLGTYVALALFLLVALAICVHRVSQYEKAADGRAIPVNGKDKYYTYIIPARRREVNEN